MEGFFVDEESQKCEACHRGCRTCRGPRYNDCDSYEEGFTLEKGEHMESKRLATCDINHFKNSTSDLNSVHFFYFKTF